MKANLNSVGDGVIVLGLGILFLTFAIVAYNGLSQNTGLSSTQTTNQDLEIAGLLTFSILFVVAGILKIIHAVKAPDQATTLKTAGLALLGAYLVGLPGFGGLLFFLYRL